MSELVSAVELRQALLGTLETLAPRGSARSVPFNVACDGMVELIADLLGAAQPATAQELERLTALFHDKLEAAMAARDGVVGHA